MPDRFSALPTELRQTIARMTFEADFGPLDTYLDPPSGLLALRINAWDFLVPDVSSCEARPHDLDALQACFPDRVVNPAPSIALLLHTRAVDLVEFDCILKGPADCSAFPGEPTLLLLQDLLERLPPGSFRFLAHDRLPIDHTQLSLDWSSRALADRWPAFKPCLIAFLYMQHSLDALIHAQADTLSDSSDEDQVDLIIFPLSDSSDEDQVDVIIFPLPSDPDSDSDDA